MGRITLIAQLQSNIQAGLKAIGGAANQVGNAINGMGAKANVATGMLGKMNNALMQAQANAAAAAANVAKLTGAQHEHGITTGRLIVMMVKFGIILNALRLITSPLGWMTEGIRSALILDRGLRNIVGMLANASDTSATLDQRFRRLMMDATGIQTRYGLSTQETVEGMYKIASVVDALNFTGVRTVVDRVNYSIDYLGNIAAKAAIAGMTDFATTADSLTAVLTGLNIPLASAADVTDILFQTVRVGKAEFKDVAQDMGTLAGAFSAITKQGQEMQMLKETGGLYGFFTTFLPPEEARVSLQRMGLFLTGESKAAQDLTEQIRQISGGTVRLRAGDVREQGLMATFRQIADFMGPDSPYLKQYVEAQAGRPVTEDELGGVKFRILTKIFDDARAARAALRVLATDGTLSLDKITAAMNDTAGASDRALGESEKSITVQFNKLRESIIATARSMSESNLPGFGDAFGGIAERLRMMLLRPAYQGSSFFGKAAFIFGDLYAAFSEWYNSGGSKQLIQISTQIGKDLGSFIMGALGLNIRGAANSKESKNAWYEAGKDIGSSFLGGFLSALNPFAGPPGSSPLQNFVSRGWASGPMRAIGTMALTRSLGGGRALQIGTGLVAGGQEEGWNLGNIAAVIGGALGFLSLARGARGGLGKLWGGGTNAAGVTLPGVVGSPLAAAGKSIWSSIIGNALVQKITAAGLIAGGAKFGGILGLLAKAKPFLGRIPLLGAGLTAGMDILGGQDPLYAIGHGIFTAGGAALGGLGAGLLGLPTGPGAILAALAGGTAGAFAGDALFSGLFGQGKTNAAAASSGVIDEYYANKSQGGMTAGGSVIIQVDKLADTITAGTPEEAEKMADAFLERMAVKLDAAAGNTGKRGGAGPIIATGGGGSW